MLRGGGAELSIECTFQQEEEEAVPEFVADDEIEESDLSDIEVWKRCYWHLNINCLLI